MVLSNKEIALVKRQMSEFKEGFEELLTCPVEQLHYMLFNDIFSVETIIRESNNHYPDPDKNEDKALEYMGSINPFVENIQDIGYSLIFSTKHSTERVSDLNKLITGTRLDSGESFHFLDDLFKFIPSQLRILQSDGKRVISPSIPIFLAKFTPLKLFLLYGRFDPSATKIIYDYIK